MAYSHYWKRPQIIRAEIFERILKDFELVLQAVRQRGILIRGWDGTGNPVFDESEIRFNGMRILNQEHETFSLQRIYQPVEWEKPDGQGRYFGFCKTALKPYDLLVCITLISAKHHYPEMEIFSDGEDADWRGARQMAQWVVGYGMNFRLDKIEVRT